MKTLTRKQANKVFQENLQQAVAGLKQCRLLLAIGVPNPSEFDTLLLTHAYDSSIMVAKKHSYKTEGSKADKRLGSFRIEGKELGRRQC